MRGAPMDLVHHRFHTQHLAGQPLARPEDVVRLLVGVQSQDYAGAKWSLGQRVAGATDAALDRAFGEGRFLRTHVLRPTWHFVTPDDIRWLLRLTAPRVLAKCAYQYPSLELNRALFRRAHSLFERALRDGRYRTRTELGAILSRGGIAARGQRLAYIVAEAELTGLVCSGPLRGKQHTYALLEERAPRARTLEREEALGELTLRFFTGHAPATARHFAWWAGITLADARAGLALVEGRLTPVEQGGHTWWVGPGHGPPRREAATARLIPEYDEALLGYSDLFPPDPPRTLRKERWKVRWPRPVILGNRRAGVWRRTIARGEALLEADLFTPLDSAGRRALEQAARRFGAFLEMPVRLVG
jgi:hypothetical protein